MQSILDLIFDPSKSQRARRVLLYGVPGIGKSTWGASWPNALFLPFEDGLRNIQCQAVPQIQSLPDLLGLLPTLYALDPFPFRTLVIDTIDALENLIFSHVATLKQKDTIVEVGYGKGYEIATREWKKVLNAFEWFTIYKQCTIVMLGHRSIEKFASPTGDTYDRYKPRLQKQSSELVQDWCDEVLFVNYKVYVREKDEGFNRTRSVGVDGGRAVYTTEKPSHYAKNRLNMPDEIGFAYQAYAQYLQPQSVPQQHLVQQSMQQPVQAQPVQVADNSNAGGDIAGIVVDGSSKSPQQQPQRPF